MSISNAPLLMSFWALLLHGACVQGEPTDLGDESADGITDFERIEILYSDFTLFSCEGEIADERCENRGVTDPGRIELPAELVGKSIVQLSSTAGVIGLESPDLRVLADKDRPMDFLLPAPGLFTATNWAMEVSYRYSPEDDWTPVHPRLGHWNSLRLRPVLGVLEGVSVDCGADAYANEPPDGSKNACNEREEAAFIDLSDAEGPIEYRIGVFPAFNFGDFNEGLYSFELAID